MIITYFRSSSYNGYSICPMQFFCTYVLGLPSVAGKKAEMGTIVHKVFECMANAKLCHQNGTTSFEDDTFGTIEIDHNYMYGASFVQWLIDKSYDYYMGKSPHKWFPRDRRDCTEWVGNVIREEMFDPRNRHVIAAEPHFNIPIEEPWAYYSFDMPDGSKLDGQLCIKGTIDLVTKIDDNRYEIIDWKSGIRKDWATDEVKDFWKLCDDPQLLMYNYAAAYMYPDKQTLMTIHYVKDGGPFTMAFSEEDRKRTLDMLRKRFDIIVNTTRPLLKRSRRWFCNRVCYYGKKAMSPTQFNERTGQPHTICSYLHQKLLTQGMDKVMADHTHPGFEIGHYQNPGS